MIHRLARWIPGHVSGKVIVTIYWILNIFNFISGSKRREHIRHNCEYLGNVLDTECINNQKAWGDIKFGAVSMAYAGCEVIATYNVLHQLGKGCGIEYMAELISDFEKDGAALGARIGTSPMAIRKLLKRRGISCRLLWNVNEASEAARLFIVTLINNRQDLYDQIHTVAIARQQNKYVVYNAAGTVTGTSLGDAISHASKDPVVVCILEIIDEH